MLSACDRRTSDSKPATSTDSSTEDRLVKLEAHVSTLEKTVREQAERITEEERTFKERMELAESKFSAINVGKNNSGVEARLPPLPPATISLWEAAPQGIWAKSVRMSSGKVA